MSDGFLGEIRLFAFGFAPEGWARCDGQLLPIVQNQALFTLVGTTYGGDGQSTFALPNLQGRLPVHVGGSMKVGQSGGELTHALTTAEMPGHRHQLMASMSVAVSGAVPGPTVVLARSNGGPLYSSTVSLVPMSGAAIAVSGASEAHENRMPYLTLSFCIALTGLYPPFTS
jgi:microcystin-dependent protein